MRRTCSSALFLLVTLAGAALAQVSPAPAEIAGYKGLLAAAAKGDAAEIRVLAAKGARPDVRDGYQRTPLHVAACGKHHAALRALVAAGANVNLPDRNRRTPLALARERGYAEMAGILEKAGAR